MPNQYNNIWNHDKVIQLFSLRDESYSFDEIAMILREKYKQPFTGSNCKSKYYRELPNKDTLMNDTYEKPFEETIRHKANGEIEHDKLIQLTEEDAKNPKRVMELCGYDPNEWEVISCQVGFWTYRDKETPDGKVSRTCKLKVKPKENRVTLEDLINHFDSLPPVRIKREPLNEIKKLLEIPIYDAHFGISTYEDYKQTQEKILTQIETGYDQIIVILGQDALHVDNFNNTTTNGTRIQDVDVIQMWEDARKFFEPIIEKAIQNSKICKVIYSPGNHDSSMSWSFTQMVKARYPQAIYDTSHDPWKIHEYGQNVIGYTHGEKNRKNLHNIFMANFPNEWGRATIREIHAGHYHVEDAKDYYGTVVRTLATRNKTDKWHYDNGFLGSHRRFQLFEYSREGLESIYYV